MTHASSRRDIGDDQLATTITDYLAAGDDGSAIRAEFAAVTIPDELRAAIAEAYADLGGGPVAVRSSATAEDLPGAAFAGQQDTYLNVVGEDAVLDAVRRCWGRCGPPPPLRLNRIQRISGPQISKSRCCPSGPTRWT